MAEAYRSRHIETTQSRVLVIHCSDPRYQPHFQDFLSAGLGLTRYGLIAVPGGCQHLSASETSEALRGHVSAWVDFMAKLMHAERCILIGHADCRWHIETRVEPDENRLKEHEARDLRGVQEELRMRYPSIRTELYYAEIEERQATFIKF